LGRRQWGNQSKPSDVNANGREATVILLGVVLLILGLVLTVHVLWIIGIVFVVLGVSLALLGSAGRRIGGRAHYF
jgi:hypothetical protein